MVTNLYFNVYYSSSPTGPWTKANDTPIPYSETGEHSYTINGLAQNTLYYIAVVGGEVHNGTFYPLLTQPIGPVAQGAGSVDAVKLIDIKSIRTFAPHITTTAALGHQFGVI